MAVVEIWRHRTHGTWCWRCRCCGLLRGGSAVSQHRAFGRASRHLRDKHGITL